MKKQWNFDFVKNSKVFAVISVCILVVGLIFSFIFPVDLDISFKGGTQIRFSYVGDLDKDALQSLMEEELGHEVDMSDATTYDGERELNTVTFYLTENLDSSVTDSAEKAAVEQYADFELTKISTNSLSPTMGNLFFVKCLVAVALAAVLLLIYVGFRFRKIGGLSAGVFGILALLHDMLIAYLAFVIFRIPLNDNFVAVMLTILGYSLNDTIVIFDRVRENRRLCDPKTPIAEIVNLSIRQSFMRTLNTALATFVAIFTVMVLALANGMDSITSFALPMTFGVVSGFYSTVFLCTPLWSKWAEHKEKREKSKKAAKKATAKK